MASISTSLSLIKFQTVSLQPVIHSKRQIIANVVLHRSDIRINSSYLNGKSRRKERDILFRVCCSSDDKEVRNEVGVSEEIPVVSRLRETTGSLTPALFVMKKQLGTNFGVGLCIVVALVGISIRAYLTGKSRSKQHGSVVDLVKRGQLRSDKRGISSPLNYDDPFNNPMVKVSKSNSTVEMCGKVYRLAPVTLTTSEQSDHQKRRSRAYQWKRPTMFLKEGDAVPPDVDPDSVRWIPTNHPFATTVSEIDEDLAQSNVYQKHGVPFRIKAEHEALQRKLETLQSEQKLNKVTIDPGNIRDYERPFKSLSHENTEQRSSGNQSGNSSTPSLERDTNFSETQTSFDEPKKP